MKIRIMGTRSECETARSYYNSLQGQENIKYVCVSGFYSCRGSSELFRLYIDIEYFETIEREAGKERRIEAPKTV